MRITSLARTYGIAATPNSAGIPSRRPSLSRWVCRSLVAGLIIAPGSAPFAGAGTGSAASAAAAIDPAAIRSIVEQYVRQNVPDPAHTLVIKVTPPDARLRLVPCAAPGPEAFLPPGSRTLGHTTIGVRCPSEAGWTLYVPTEIRQSQPTLVLTRPLATDSPIAASDLRVELRDEAGLQSSTLSKPEDAIGMIVRRQIEAGRPLRAEDLKPPRFVRRGDIVSIIVESGPLVVRSQGIALSDGHAGETISVRNPLTRKEIRGTVSEPGVIRLPL